MEVLIPMTTTTAVKQDDGSYLLNGSKIFITNGGGGFGFVLARVPNAPEGLNGISLFLGGSTFCFSVTTLKSSL